MLSKLNGNQITCPGNPATSAVKHIREQKGYGCGWGGIKLCQRRVCPGGDCGRRVAVPGCGLSWHVVWNTLACCTDETEGVQRHPCSRRSVSHLVAVAVWLWQAALLASRRSILWSRGFPARGPAGGEVQTLQLPIGSVVWRHRPFLSGVCAQRVHVKKGLKEREGKADSALLGVPNRVKGDW